MDFLWRLKSSNGLEVQQLIDGFDFVEGLLQLSPVGEASGNSCQSPTNEPPVLSRPSGDLLPVSRQSVHDVLTPVMAPHPASTLRDSLQHNINKIRQASLVKEACISEIFFCHSQDELCNLIAAFNEKDDKTTSPVVMSEMYAAAATSGQYARDLLDPDLLDRFYGQ